MSTKTKTTSQEAVEALLKQHGWEYTTAPITIEIPAATDKYGNSLDPDATPRSGWGRRRRQFVIKVEGTKISAAGGTTPVGDQVFISAAFDHLGRYVAEETAQNSGYVGLYRGAPLKWVLEVIKDYSPEAARQRWRQENDENTRRADAEAEKVEADLKAELESLHGLKVTATDTVSEVLRTLKLELSEAPRRRLAAAIVNELIYKGDALALGVQLQEVARVGRGGSLSSGLRYHEYKDGKVVVR